MSQARKLRISYGGCSRAGVKERNEDAFAAILPGESQRFSKGAVASLADGASCSENAQLASQTSVTTFIQDYLSTPETWDVKTSASRVLAALNAWLFRQGALSVARHNACVTTFTAVICKSASAHVLHCGDSRLYRWRGGSLRQLTTDHSLLLGDGGSILTRALGMDSELKVDYQQRSLREGDLLLLSSDGLHGSLEHDELGEMLRSWQEAESVTEGVDRRLEKLAQTLVARAEAAGSQDNLSCLLLKVLEVPLEDIDESHRRLTKLAIPPVLEPGNRLDGYTILKVLHSGPRSHLYLASHPRYRQHFVLKMPSENFAEDPQYLEGFLREQWVGRRIAHDSIMKIHDPVPDSRFLYHICEYIDGITLRQWMYDNPHPELSVAREVIARIAAALRVFQRMGMLHRDLKPENIMLLRDGGVKLIDFGTVLVGGLREVSSAVSEDLPAGTADYIAPEALLGQGGISRSDIFSLGVLAYELLTASLPYSVSASPGRRPDNYAAWQYRSALGPRSDLPLWVDLALARACAPRPSQRYQALSEFVADIERPNQALLSRHQQRPLIERNPLRFWQVVSGVLFALLVLQFALQHG